jgi:hypothetical protein
VLEERLDDRRRAGADVRAHPGGFDDVERPAGRGHEDLGRELVVLEDLHDLADEIHARGGDVVQPTHERADVGRSHLGGEQRLGRGEDQRDVDADAFRRERLAGLHPRLGERHLHHDVLVELGELAPLAQHAVDVGGDDFGAGRPLHDLADALQQRPVVAPFFGEQRRVGGDAVDDAERHQGLDFLQVSRVDEQLHGYLS